MLQVLNVLYGVILGATPGQNGFIAGGYGLSYLLMAAILGRLGDKMPRKRSLLFALISQISVSIYFLFIANAVLLLIIGQIVLGCAYGFYWPSIEAYISENTEHSDFLHQKGISNFCISWSIGYTFGPFLAGVFSDINVRIGYLIVLAVYLMSLVIMAMFIPNHYHEPEKIIQTEATEPLNESESIKVEDSKLNLHVIRILFGMFVYAMIGRIVLSYFADYASRPQGLGLTGTEVGLMLFGFGIGRTGYFIISRYLKSSLTRLVYSYLMITVFMILIGYIAYYGVLFTIIAIFGIFSGLIYKTSLELLMKYEKEAKGAKAGLFESMIGMGSATSPIIAGLLAEISLVLPFFIFAGVALFLFLFNFILERKDIGTISQVNKSFSSIQKEKGIEKKK